MLFDAPQARMGVPRTKSLRRPCADTSSSAALALLEEIAEAQASRGVALGDEDAMALAVTEVRAARAERARRASA